LGPILTEIPDLESNDEMVCSEAATEVNLPALKQP